MPARHGGDEVEHGREPLLGDGGNVGVALGLGGAGAKRRFGRVDFARLAALVMRVTISQMSVSATKWSRCLPSSGTRWIRPQPSNSLIELDTLDRARPSWSAIVFRGQRAFGEIKQGVDLRDRAVDPPLTAEIAPVQDEPGDRHRQRLNSVVVIYFCHNRNICYKQPRRSQCKKTRTPRRPRFVSE